MLGARSGVPVQQSDMKSLVLFRSHFCTLSILYVEECKLREIRSTQGYRGMKLKLRAGFGQKQFSLSESSPPLLLCLSVPPWPSSPSPSSCPWSTGLHLACLLTPALSYASSILPVSQELFPLDSGRRDRGFGSRADLGSKLGMTTCVPRM